jgi:hypothetical protein
MFPNIRLMVVAILAAIAGIGCGLGLFATFRVNHEPLARLADGSPPLQLAFEKLGLNSQLRPPLEARLPVNGDAKPNSVAVIPTPGPDHAGAGAAISGDSAAGQPALGGTAEMDQSSGVNVAAVNATEQSTATREDIAPRPQEAAPAAVDQRPSAPPGEPAASGPLAPSAEQTAAIDDGAMAQEPTASSPMPQSAEQTAAIDAGAAAQDPTVSSAMPQGAEQTAAAIKSGAADQEPAASSPAAPSAEQTAAVNTAATDREPEAKPAKPVASKTAKPAARAAHPAPPHHVARVVRAHRTVAAAASQPAAQYSQTLYAQPAYTQPTYTQPTYGWAAGASQASQPVKRVQIKRHRPANKPVPAAQSNPSPPTAGLSGTP